VGELMGTPFDHTVMLDFNGFRALTDALGGIDVDVTLPTAGTGTVAGGASVVFPDYGGIAQVAAAMREGRLPEYAR
jgi:anionic cell wall polymer biosynthesis LytR-Cps2A-Psr (LCP) family protein